jgi:flagellar motor switch protein FliM
MGENESASTPAAMFRVRSGAPEPVRKALDAAFAVFAREAGMQISAYLRSTVISAYDGLQEGLFSAYMAGRSEHSCAAVVQADGLRWRALLDIQSSLFFVLLELMLGAKPGGRASVQRAPTEVEKQLLAVLLRPVIAELERAYGQIAGDSAPVKFVFGGIESDARVGDLFGATTPIIAARVKVAIGERSGFLTVVMPVQAVSAGFDAAVAEVGDPGVEVAEDARVYELLSNASVRIDAWLDDVTMQFRDLAQLREGYVIKFDHATTRTLSCTVNGAPAFHGQVVSTGRKRAFLIENKGAL